MRKTPIRLAMHPADQFEAFAALIDQGESAADVACRFGVEESLVLKRMKLARVAPQLLAEYRGDGMTLECLDGLHRHRRPPAAAQGIQVACKTGRRTTRVKSIRAALTEKLIEAGSKLARFRRTWMPTRRLARAYPRPTCSARKSISKSRRY